MEKKDAFATPLLRRWLVHVPQKLLTNWNRVLPGVNGRTVLLALPVVCSLYILHLFLVYTSYPDVVYEVSPSRVHSGAECVLPDLDAFDPEVMKFIEPYPPLNCQAQPYLSYVDGAGFLHVNQTEFDQLQYTTPGVSCVYYPMTRREEDDDSVVSWKKKPLVVGVPAKLDVVVVKVVCEDANNKVIYHQTHNYITPPDDEMKSRNKKLVDQGRPNVLLMGFDSMSRQNFMRQLPKTYAFLTKTLGSTILKGLTKVADNTQPNMFAFLSGVTLREPRTDVPGPFWDVGMYKDWSGRTDNDSAPVLWKNVTREGYITMYFDDSSGHAKYNIQPTDYYGKPFYLALETCDNADMEIPINYIHNIFEVNFWGSENYCRKQYPVQVVHFDYVKRFVARMRGSVYFALPYLVRISHEGVNSVQVIDDDLVALLEQLHDDGDLDNTVLLVFGDHGQRFGPIRDSVQGTIENKMPFMSVTLPPKMRREKPHLQAGLDSNADRLLSWFDMHELLMDLVMDNLEAESRVQRWAYNGLSPFRAMPRNRTCYDAVIPTEYCVCTQPAPINVSDFTVQAAAADLMHYINGLLSPARPACAELSLRAIESAELLSHDLDPVKLVRVNVRVNPSDGLLQGIVEQRPHNETGTIIGTVDRLDKYGNQSNCVRSYSDRRLLLYCFCDEGLRQ